MNKKVTQSQLIEELSIKTGISRTKSQDFINRLIESTLMNINSKGKASITNFGSFTIVEAEKRTGINPKTGKPLVIPAHKRISFTPYKALEKKVNTEFAYLRVELPDSEIKHANLNHRDEKKSIDEVDKIIDGVIEREIKGEKLPSPIYDENLSRQKNGSSSKQHLAEEIKVSAPKNEMDELVESIINNGKTKRKQFPSIYNEILSRENNGYSSDQHLAEEIKVSAPKDEMDELVESIINNGKTKDKQSPPIYNEHSSREKNATADTQKTREREQDNFYNDKDIVIKDIVNNTTSLEKQKLSILEKFLLEENKRNNEIQELFQEIEKTKKLINNISSKENTDIKKPDRSSFAKLAKHSNSIEFSVSPTVLVAIFITFCFSVLATLFLLLRTNSEDIINDPSFFENNLLRNEESTNGEDSGFLNQAFSDPQKTPMVTQDIDIYEIPRNQIPLENQIINDQNNSYKFTINKGSWIYDIARKTYGNPNLWPLIFQKNYSVNTDPDLIYPNTDVNIPLLEGTTEDLTLDDYLLLAQASFYVAEAYKNAGKPKKATAYYKNAVEFAARR